jgi:hypothetical protein
MPPFCAKTHGPPGLIPLSNSAKDSQERKKQPRRRITEVFLGLEVSTDKGRVRRFADEDVFCSLLISNLKSNLRNLCNLRIIVPHLRSSAVRILVRVHSCQFAVRLYN